MRRYLNFQKKILHTFFSKWRLFLFSESFSSNCLAAINYTNELWYLHMCCCPHKLILTDFVIYDENHINPVMDGQSTWRFNRSDVINSNISAIHWATPSLHFHKALILLTDNDITGSVNVNTVGHVLISRPDFLCFYWSWEFLWLYFDVVWVKRYG